MIFYFIYSGRFNSKVGGHYQSLKTISKAISKESDVFIFVLGHSFIDIYTKEGIPNTFVKVSLFNFPIVIYKLVKKIKKYSPKSLHAFDSFAYYIVRILSFLTNTSSCITKCGGPNFTHFAVCQNTIFFSNENFKYYSGLLKFNKTHKYLLPNRVIPQQHNLKRLASVTIDPSYEGIKFLRINRIGVYYKKTMTNSINLVNLLNNNGIKCRLYIIGYVTEENVIKDLPINDHVRLLTEEKFYVNASELIPLFDCVIGTGRSAMEAFSYKKIVLSPILNGNTLIIVDDYNIQNFLDVNFSERVDLRDYNEEDYQAKLLTYDWKNHITKNNSLDIFNRYFNVDSVISNYLEIYSLRYKKKLFVKDFLFHTLLFIGKHILDSVRGVLPNYNTWFANQVMKLIGGKGKSI